ncbi:MAG: polyamine ABC transporter substrate-binding protein [Caldilineaceae bacterium]
MQTKRWWDRSRRGASLGVAMATVLLLAACGGGGAEEDEAAFVCPEPNPRVELTSTELNLFVWTEYSPEEMIDCFEEAYGITVNRDEFSSNEEMYAKISAGNTSYDLAQPTDQIVELMVRQNLLTPLEKERLPALANFGESFLNQPFDPTNAHTVPYQAGLDAIVVNAANVETMPAAFADLWNEEYAGRMVMVDDARTIIGATLLTLGYDINTTDPAQIEEAGVRLADLVDGVKIFDSDSPKTALIAGDADLGIVWTGEAKQAADEVETVEFIYPSEGAIRWMDNWAIPAGAPNPDAAYAWINYINQPELFWTTMRDFPYLNPNQASIDWAQANQPELYDSYMGSTITNVPADVLAGAHRITDVGDATPLYDRIWTEVKGQ